jgi:hypothetical protein
LLDLLFTELDEAAGWMKTSLVYRVLIGHAVVHYSRRQPNSNCITMRRRSTSSADQLNGRCFSLRRFSPESTEKLKWSQLISRLWGTVQQPMDEGKPDVSDIALARFLPAASLSIQSTTSEI